MVVIRRNPSRATLETYKVNMSNFDDGKPKEFLALLRNRKIATDRTGMTSPSVSITYLCTLLRGESLR